jgi:hypothetical protein
MQAIAVLVFGLMVIILESIIMMRRQQGIGPSFIRIVGVTLVLTVAVFLAVSNQAQDRFGQSLGFLGTIAGYLLGKSDSQAGG